jgi:hypothetical protein
LIMMNFVGFDTTTASGNFAAWRNAPELYYVLFLGTWYQIARSYTEGPLLLQASSPCSCTHSCSWPAAVTIISIFLSSRQMTDFAAYPKKGFQL